MSIIYRIEKDLGLTLVRWDGLVTAEEFPCGHTEVAGLAPEDTPSPSLHGLGLFYW